MPRTAHRRTTHTQQLYPVWGEGADGPELRTGGKAAQGDRDQRVAYPGQKLRSAYLSRVQMPASVPPGDVATARAIHDRIVGCLQEEGKWTESERARLRGMREAWARRMSGRDVEFQYVGWVKRPPKGEPEWRRLEREDARSMARVLEALDV